MRKKLFIVVSLILSSLIIPRISFADETKPTDVVRELLKSISMIKDDSTTKLTPEEEKNNKKLKENANALIYISILGPKTLGSHWKKRTPEEKKAFFSVLTNLFKKVAYPKSAKFFTDLEITYDNEIIKKEKAVVQTSMEHESEGLIEIEYKLQKVDRKWLISDVILDEVSLVLNLKTQFHKVIQKESFERLINKMTDRLKEK